MGERDRIFGASLHKSQSSAAVGHVGGISTLGVQAGEVYLLDVGFGKLGPREADIALKPSYRLIIYVLFMFWMSASDRARLILSFRCSACL